VRYLLDEDVNPAVADVARGLGLDVTSVHELGRWGLPDEEQLRFATSEGRILVTRNRNDFIRLLRATYASGEECTIVLVLPYTLPNQDAARMAHALKRWHDRYVAYGNPGYGFLDFLH
jgi:predicted nuclease of predicted toxin-antitoxin system